MSPALLAIRDFNNQWTLTAAASFVVWCLVWVKPKLGAIPAALLAYTGLSAIYVWVLTNNRYLPVASYDHHVAQALKYSAADSFGKMILLLLPLLAFSKNRHAMRMYGELACYIFVLLNSIVIGVALLNGCRALDNSCGGMIGNPSIGVGLMVCMLPVFIHSWREQWKILSLAALSVFASKSSIAMGLFAAYGALFLIPWGSLHKAESGMARLLLKASAFGAGTLGMARLALGDQLTNDSDRFHIWKFMMARWPTALNMRVGTGIGTYHVFSINLQDYALKSYPDLNIGTGFWWSSLHNEPLEFLFVGGFVGLALFLATYFKALVNAAKTDVRIAISILLYGLYMTVDPALHHPLPALFGAWLFVYALRIERHPLTYRRLT